MIEDDVEIGSPYGIKETKFSSLSKLLRVTAWCSRFINNIKGMSIQGYLLEEEIAESMEIWTKYIQEIHFKVWIDAKSRNRWNSVKSSLGVRRDEHGILRCHGRFMNENMAPKFLPKKNYFTDLVIRGILWH